MLQAKGAPIKRSFMGKRKNQRSVVSFGGSRSEQHGVCSDDGGLAQLGERLPCKQEVSGSIPLISTTQKTRNPKNKIEASFDFERKN